MTKTFSGLALLASCLWAQEGTGPFPALMEQDPGLPTHTIYRPKELAAPGGVVRNNSIWHSCSLRF